MSIAAAPKILISKRRGLGDTILLSSTIAIFKQRFPNSKITVLVPEAFAEILQGNPHLNTIWTYEENSALGLMLKIRREKFDYYFNLHSTLGWGEWLARLSGAKHIFTHIQNKQAVLKYGKHPTALEWDSFFLKTVMSDSERITAPAPKIYLREEECAWAKDFLTRRGAVGAKTVFLGLGASRATKRWPAEMVARFSELLRDRGEYLSLIVVGPDEADQTFSGNVLDYLRVKGFRPQLSAKDSGGVVFESGFTLRQLAALLAEVKMYVGNDSGPKHLAVAVGTPTITLFGPEDPGEWHPYDLREHPIFFTKGLSCRTEDGGRWCGISECVVEKHRCMTDLDPLDVYERFASMTGAQQ